MLFGVLTAITYAGFILFLREAGRDLRRPAGPLFDATAVAAVVAALAGAAIGDVDLVPSWPAHGWLSDGFGRRQDPFTGEVDFHQGLDISTDKGRPVYATADGIVETASYSGAYGNLVSINHGFGVVTRYGHLSKLVARAGTAVHRGDVVGYVGSTGRATGTHLHYEVLLNGRFLNPLQLLTEPRR